MIEFGHTMQSSLDLCIGRRIFSLFRFIISVRSNVDKLEMHAISNVNEKKTPHRKWKQQAIKQN